MEQPIMLTISAAEWDGIQHRPHHFMRRSARSGWKVIYVEPPATLIAPLKNKKMLERWKCWRKGLRKTEEGIYLLAPPPTLPFGNKYRWVNKFNQWLISRSIKKALSRFKASEIDLFTFLPNIVDMLPSLSARKVIYDCVDDHAAFTGLINADVVHQMEKELMARADVSFSTARQLMEDRQGWSSNFHLVPNGAEYEHFEAASQEGTFPLPAELQAIPKPIVGFYGGISDWINIPLITEVAREMTHLSFVFIGPVATQVEELKKLPNVHMLGTKAYQDLPQYIQYFDTTLIPFRINKLTESVNPVKLYEYLSAGKPVVSTPLPEVLSYREVVEIGSTKEELISAIVKTIQPESHTSEQIAKRQEVGRTNSWDARWEQIVALIQEGQPKEKREYVTKR